MSKKTIIDASMDELSKAPNVGPAETKAWKQILEREASMTCRLEKKPLWSSQSLGMSNFGQKIVNPFHSKT